MPATGGAVWAVFEDAHTRPALPHTAGERLVTAPASQTASGCYYREDIFIERNLLPRCLQPEAESVCAPRR